MSQEELILDNIKQLYQKGPNTNYMEKSNINS